MYLQIAVVKDQQLWLTLLCFLLFLQAEVHAEPFVDGREIAQCADVKVLDATLKGGALVEPLGRFPDKPRLADSAWAEHI